jgi:hypothetical protein
VCRPPLFVCNKLLTVASKSFFKFILCLLSVKTEVFDGLFVSVVAVAGQEQTKQVGTDF